MLRPTKSVFGVNSDKLILSYAPISGIGFSAIAIKSSMKDKAYDPARHNEQSPAPGFASVNTHNAADGETDKKTDEQLFNREEANGADESRPGEGAEGRIQGLGD